MAVIEKINFSYPRGTLQSNYDVEEMTALELASKTSHKVDECVDQVNAVGQTAVQSQAIVEEMKVAQDEFILGNNDARTTLLTENQALLDSLETSNTTFQNAVNASKTTYETNMNTSLAQFQTSLESSKTDFVNTTTTEFNAYKSSLSTSKSTFETDMTNSINTFNANGNQAIVSLVNDANNTLIPNTVNTKIETMLSNGELTTAVNQQLIDPLKVAIAQVSINVKDFGAKGDNVTNDTTAFVNAINSLPTEGGIINVPKGTYIIDSFTIGKPITLVGVGTNSSILKTTSATANVITLNASYVTIKNIGLSSTVVRSNGAFIYEHGQQYITIQNVRFEKHYIGVDADGGAHITIKNNEFWDATPDSVVSGGMHIRGGNTTYTGHLVITENFAQVTLADVTKAPTYGILLKYVDVCNITDNLILISGQCICISPTTGQFTAIVLCQNNCFDTSFRGISLMPTNGAYVVNCQFSNNQFSVMTDNGIFMYVHSTDATSKIDNIIISNNSFWKNALSGVYMNYRNINNITIISNNFTENTVYGVVVDAVGYINVKSNNFVKNGQGMLVTPTATGEATGNYFKENTTASLTNLSGTLFRVGDNTGASWQSWDSTITSTVGTLTTVSSIGKYTVNGNKVTFTLKVTVTANGTGSGMIQFTLPYPTKSSFIASGRCGAVSSKMVQGVANELDTLMTVLNYDGSYPSADGEIIYISGTYEI